MKKLLPVFLALSLVANAAFLLRSFLPASLDTAAPASAAKTSSARAASGTATAADKLAALRADAELSSLQDKLAKLNLPPDVTQEVLRAMLWKPLRDRQRAMMDAKVANKPYWQQTGNADKRLTPDERAELRALSTQIEARAASLFGDTDNKAAARYSFLAPEKAASLYQLHRDYGDMMNGVDDETSLFRVPSDNATRKLLREEQRRDLEAILSPAELAEYDLHYSSTATDLRRRFAGLPDSTESEYKAAYDIAQTLASGKNNAAAQAEAAQQLRELLGPDRYATFLRANDDDYTALQGAAARFEIPAATIDKVYGLRDQAVALSQQIASDQTLSAKDKQAALKNLSSQLRNDVRDSLGAEIGNAYLDKNMNWLGSLANGSVLSLTPMGKLNTKPIAKDGNGANPANGNLSKKQQKAAEKPVKEKAGKKGK